MDYKKVIESRYNRESWQLLLHDIFHNKVSFWNRPSEVRVSSRLAKQALNLGKISLSDGESIAIYEVELNDNVDIERNRRGIRDMLTSDWRNMGYAGAFMFCYRKNESVLRFSYVSESWSFAEDGTYKKDSTDTKRFTYLLGEGHRSRTAIQQFEGLKKSSLTLQDLTKAFSVDAVSDMFFHDYKQQYEDIIAFITGKRMVKVANKWEEKIVGEPNEKIFSEFMRFSNPEKAIRDYVKKLMGRIVFLQFLQKKGWLGVPIKAKWGEGDKEFIQNLFINTQDKDHFIDNVLEYLFNDINTERAGDLVSPEVGKDIRVPYLNGGLFEPDAADATEFPLPAKYMKSMQDFFSSYNFTIDENDPDDAEMGVDPEMLGRIFENLLEDNKDKGAFYTPKEIVAYMCRESLIAYLQTDIEKEEQKEAIRQFVTNHQFVQHLPGDILEMLKNVKICDPAIGSGAFPMGLLKELFLCRGALEGFDQKKSAEIKKHIIQQNIYGVDIEKGAVDIARLRFWLSLIVDEETPEALPNLDFKIMQGNSLLEQYKGIDLSTMTEKKVSAGGSLTIFDSMLDVYRKELRDKLALYYNCPDHNKKKELRKEIVDIVKKELYEEGINVDFGNLDLAGNDQFFLWHTWFHDVFSRPSKEGFYIVIGNPPYIDSETMTKIMPDVRAEYAHTFSTARGNWDIYIIFYEQGMNLLNSCGHLSFITPNKWLSIGYGKTLRKKCFDNLISLCDCQRIKVFEAGNEPTICFLSNSKVEQGSITVSRYETDNSHHILQQISKMSLSSEDLGALLSEHLELLMKIKKHSCCIGDYIDSENPFSTAEAYDLIPLVHDGPFNAGTFKLINTGTIDPYISFWGIYKTAYLKRKYNRPIIDRMEFKKKFPRRMRQATASKIIISGMRYFEAFLDTEGDYIAGKSTIILLNAKKEEYYKILLGILNSKLISFYLKQSYSTLGIGGGINYSNNMVAAIPCPPLEDSHLARQIIPFVDTILRCRENNPQVENLDSLPEYYSAIVEIEKIVSKLYCLSIDNVHTIDCNSIISEKDLK